MKLPVREFAISIHALREEGDTLAGITATRATDFYPRPPRGGRPARPQLPRKRHLFLSTPSARRATELSTPALEEERFLSTPSARRATAEQIGMEGGEEYFYPRPPRGGRLAAVVAVYKVLEFLSTPSARRATGISRARLPACSISIHALREEGDYTLMSGLSQLIYFYPRPPRGGRPLSPVWFLTLT